YFVAHLPSITRKLASASATQRALLLSKRISRFRLFPSPPPLYPATFHISRFRCILSVTTVLALCFISHLTSVVTLVASPIF
ncbi:hypothetical protein V1527DRAFT_491034, partial [Lipomyces starkeyi]